MTALNLADEHAQMGSISLNFERHGDKEEVVGMAISYALMLAQPQLDELMGKYFHRSLFNTDKTGLAVPVDGFRRCQPLQVEDNWEGVKVRLVFAEADLEFAGCKAQKLVLEPQVGGLTKLRLQIYLNPGISDENLILQEHVHREVNLQITDGKIALKKNPKQGTLPLEPAKADGDRPVSGGFQQPPGQLERVEADMRARNPDGPTMGEHAAGSPSDAEQDEIDAQAAALSAKPGEVVDGRSERVKHKDRRKEHA